MKDYEVAIEAVTYVVVKADNEEEAETIAKKKTEDNGFDYYIHHCNCYCTGEV